MLTARLKGGALYIALIICIVISIILSVFILIAHFNQKQVLAQLANNQLNWNLRSAFQIAQSQTFSEAQNNKWFKTEFNEDSIKIKSLQWGAYALIEAQSKNRHQLISEAGLYGSYATPDTALYIVDGGRPVSLAGTIKFNGGVYFPKAGFKSAYIEGFGSVIDPNFNSFVRISASGIPQPAKQMTDKLLNVFKVLNENTDSLGSLDRNQVNQPFSSKTLVIKSGNINLSGYRLSNNIKLVANHEIILDSSAHINNVLLIAEKVRFKKGFTGTVQVIANDSIIVENECYLKYPSSLTVISDQTDSRNMKGIFIAEKCRIEGSLLALRVLQSQSKLNISTKKECTVFGLIYSSDYASLQGTLYGTIYCSKLLLQTPSAVYENHILNCNIDPKKYVNSIYLPAIFENNKTKKCIKKL